MLETMPLIHQVFAGTVPIHDIFNHKLMQLALSEIIFKLLMEALRDDEFLWSHQLDHSEQLLRDSLSPVEHFFHFIDLFLARTHQHQALVDRQEEQFIKK